MSEVVGALRRKFILTVALLGAFVIVGAGLPVTAEAAPGDAAAIQKIVDQTNAIRAAAGLRPLARDARIDSVAAAWSGAQASSGTMKHNPNYSEQMPAGWTRAAENVAYGYAPDRVVEAWKNSPGHYANMIGDYSHIGVGMARAVNGQIYYTQNFGKYATPPANAPIGSIDSVGVDPLTKTATVQGWAGDADSRSAIDVHIYVDGKMAARAATGGSRPDVGRKHPALGSNTGFAIQLTAQAGTHEVCAYGINVGPAAANTRLGCRIYSLGANPEGRLDSATISGFRTASVTGWAIDPDTAASIPVHLYVNGSHAASTTASTDRPDIARSRPGYGPAHGYSAEVALRPGTNTVCAFGINQGSGSVNSSLGCKTVASAKSGSPFGAFDAVTATASRTASVSGWAIDPDTTAPVLIHVKVNDKVVGRGYATSTRSDVGRAHPEFGPDRGYAVSVPLAAGQNTVCAFALNQGPAAPTRHVGCKTITAR